MKKQKYIARTCVFSSVGILLLMLLFSSCRSVQYVPVDTKVLLKDSVITRDSLIIKEKTVQKDSVVCRDSTVLVVDKEGNVVRTELYRYRDSYKELSRDYSALQVKYDSLLSVKQEEIQVPYPIERQLTKWQSVKMELGGWAFGIIIAFILIILARTLYYRRKQ